MAFLLHQTLLETAARAPDARLLSHDMMGDASAAEFAREVAHLAAQLQRLGIKRNERVGIFLPKLPLAAYAFYAVAMAGAVFVPINPLLKRAQVTHILNDCGVRVPNGLNINEDCGSTHPRHPGCGGDAKSC